MLIGYLDLLRLIKLLVGQCHQIPGALVVRIAAKQILEVVYGNCGLAVVDLFGEYFKHKVWLVREKLLNPGANFGKRIVIAPFQKQVCRFCKYGV